MATSRTTARIGGSPRIAILLINGCRFFMTHGCCLTTGQTVNCSSDPMSTSVGPTGRNLFEEIRRVSGLSLKGRYKRYKAKKWKWIGTSDVVASARRSYEVFAAEFRDKFDTPYTFVVAVDLLAGRICPVEELNEETRERINAWLQRSGSETPGPVVATSSKPKKAKQSYSLWLGEVDVPPHPKMPNPEIPRLLLGSSGEDPLVRIDQLNAGLIQGSGFARRHPIRPRLDLLNDLPRSVRGQPSYSKIAHVKARKGTIRDYLREEGFVVDLSNGNVVYTVYVVNLSDGAGQRINPHRWVYVGQTAKTPEERLKEHQMGHKASKWVKNFEEGLNYRLFSSSVPQVRFRQDAETIEAQLAKDLEARGFNVKGGH